MKRNQRIDLAHICLLVLVPGLAAWLTGKPLIFPSLGPSAFSMVPGGKEEGAWRMIGGHFIGAVCGFVAYHILARGLNLTSLVPALSLNGLRIVTSGVASILLTSWLMTATRANHAPACATTLIVSLGLLSSFSDVLLIMSAVIGMFLLHRLILRMRK